MIDASLRILRADVAGMPIEWIGFEEAVKLHCLEQILYPMGSPLYTVHGGVNARSGKQSALEVYSIICTIGQSRSHLKRLPTYTPPLNNVTLFRRDANLCLYCGGRFRNLELSRDHVRPISRGGVDKWQNVVSACKRCNHHKGNRLPEEAGMQLLAVPFVPTHAEYIYLSGKRILADQMEFLLAHFPRNSLLHQRLDDAA
ncbi:MAG: HNH endonuclease [Acidiferrobacteraceae bacterium]|jgi:hypothetical protein|nr:HNH endonuclease [Acidiferrobacteraceae bacterium]MDP7563444.1 HNH endonuclease [Arenicellales bacterium]